MTSPAVSHELPMRNADDTVDVSIIIVNWNTRELLLACLGSVYAQAYTFRYEVIVSENGSNDGSEDAVRAHFPNARILQNGADLGFGAGMNAGVRLAKGRILCVLAPDAVVLPGVLQRLYDRFSGDSFRGVVSCKLVGPDGHWQVSCSRFTTPLRVLSLLTRIDRLIPVEALQTYYDRYDWRSLCMVDWPHDERRLVDTVLGAFFLLPMDVYREVSGFDPRFFMYYEEVDLFRTLRSRGVPVEFLPDVSIVHYGGEATKLQYSMMRFEQQKSLLIYLRKWHGARVTAIVQIFLVAFAVLRVVALHLTPAAQRRRDAASAILKGLVSTHP